MLLSFCLWLEQNFDLSKLSLLEQEMLFTPGLKRNLDSEMKREIEYKLT
jgi:hypothetical protein